MTQPHIQPPASRGGLLTAAHSLRLPISGPHRDTLHHVGVGVRKLGLATAMLIMLFVVAAPVVVVAFGYRPTIIEVDSMGPSLARGDLAVSELVSPSMVQPGDVITFSDPNRDGATFTERVVDVQQVGAVFALTSEAETDGELHAWSMIRGDQVERIAYRMPVRPRDLASSPVVQGGLVLVAAVSLLVAGWRRV